MRTMLLHVLQHAAKGKLCRSRYEGERSHWLYYADDRYDVSDSEKSEHVMVLIALIPLLSGPNSRTFLYIPCNL